MPPHQLHHEKGRLGPEGQAQAPAAAVKPGGWAVDTRVFISYPAGFPGPGVGAAARGVDVAPGSDGGLPAGPGPGARGGVERCPVALDSTLPTSLIFPLPAGVQIADLHLRELNLTLLGGRLLPTRTSALAQGRCSCLMRRSICRRGQGGQKIGVFPPRPPGRPPAAPGPPGGVPPG